MKKRITAIFLLLTMILSSIPVMAENLQTSAGIPSFLECMGIGLPEKDVNLDDNQRPVTKAEFVYLVVQAMGKNAYMEEKYLTFPDVKLDSWYHNNVIIAAEKGLVFGHEDGFFGVDDQMNEETAAVIMLRALGFGILPKFSEDKSLASIHSGVKSDLLKGISRDGTLSLEEAYKAIYNMLLSDYVALSFTESVTYHVETDKAYMEYAFDVRRETGRVTGNKYTRFGISGGAMGKNMLEIDGVAYSTTLDNSEIYLGYGVEYFVSESDLGDEEVIYMIPMTQNEVTEISSSDIQSCQVQGGDIVIKYRKNSGSIKNLSIPMSCDFVYNDKVENFSVNLIDELITDKVGQIRIVEFKDYVMLDVTAYDTMIVDTVSLYDEIIYGRYGVDPVSVKEQDGEFITIEKDGAPCAVSDINKDDVIQVANTLDGCSKKIIICNFTIDGAVTEGISDKEIAIDDVVYPVSNYFIVNRQANITIRLGLKQKFLFNTYGELVDIVEDSAEYVGEYVFLIEAKNMGEPDEHIVRLKYVTLDANMITAYLEEKVRYNGKKEWAGNVASNILPAIGGASQRRIIYIEKNSEGNVTVINTPEQTTVGGVYNEDDIITCDAAEKKRKCKQQSAWLVDTNDANFPEFYTDDDTKILMVPVSSADTEAFKNISNYEVKTAGYFQDAKDYIVEAYNLDEYNVAGIMLLRQEQVYNTQMSNNNLMLVTSVGATINEEGEVVPKVKGYQDGEYVEVKLKDNDVATYYNKPTKKIAKYDVVRFNVDNKGYAIHSEYVKNVVSDCEITDHPEGQNNGNAIVVGRVVSQKDNYLRLRFTGNATVKERVFRGNVQGVTIFEDNKCHKGTVGDLVPGSLVLIRVFYTTLNDVIVIK